MAKKHRGVAECDLLGATPINIDVNHLYVACTTSPTFSSSFAIFRYLSIYLYNRLGRVTSREKHKKDISKKPAQRGYQTRNLEINYLRVSRFTN